MARATRKQILGKKRINLARKLAKRLEKQKPAKMAQIWLIASQVKEFGKE